MDPATLGAAVATVLAARAAESLGRRPGGGAAQELSEKVRTWFAEHGDSEALRTLDVVERYPEAERAVDDLAQHVELAAASDVEFSATVESQIWQIPEIRDRSSVAALSLISLGGRVAITYSDRKARGREAASRARPDDEFPLLKLWAALSSLLGVIVIEVVDDRVTLPALQLLDDVFIFLGLAISASLVASLFTARYFVRTPYEEQLRRRHQRRLAAYTVDMSPTEDVKRELQLLQSTVRRLARHANDDGRKA